jgi:hypothetical protein
MQQPSHPPAHPLSHPLPPDVAAGESAFIHFYQRFTVFSWAWAWRRTLLFGAIGVLAGASFGASHGLYAHDAGQAIAVGLACSAANLMLVGAGPLLAAFFRHRSMSPHLQRVAIVMAVAAGIVLGAWTGELASSYHDALMAGGSTGTSTSVDGSMDVHSLVRRLLNVSREILILFVASGGLALPVYFSEKRRWAEHWRRAQLEKVAQQHSELEAKLTLLQAQVEPHFLFNTLASVRSLVSTDPERASRTIDALAHHLRATLPRMRAETGARQSTLGEQFAICASYLDLMKVRLGERLRVELSLPDELREVSFPPLLLISLVENAIKHGAEPNPAPTRVTLEARTLSGEDAPRLEVSVEDDGAGLTLGMGEGTGLANVRAQLLARFGAAASFELSQRTNGGVRAVMTLPLERARA